MHHCHKWLCPSCVLCINIQACRVPCVKLREIVLVTAWQLRVDGTRGKVMHDPLDFQRHIVKYAYFALVRRDRVGLLPAACGKRIKVITWVHRLVECTQQARGRLDAVASNTYFLQDPTIIIPDQYAQSQNHQGQASEHEDNVTDRQRRCMLNLRESCTRPR